MKEGGNRKSKEDRGTPTQSTKPKPTQPNPTSSIIIILQYLNTTTMNDNSHAQLKELTIQGDKILEEQECHRNQLILVDNKLNCEDRDVLRRVHQMGGVRSSVMRTGVNGSHTAVGVVGWEDQGQQQQEKIDQDAVSVASVPEDEEEVMSARARIRMELENAELFGNSRAYKFKLYRHVLDTIPGANRTSSPRDWIESVLRLLGDKNDSCDALLADHTRILPSDSMFKIAPDHSAVQPLQQLDSDGPRSLVALDHIWKKKCMFRAFPHEAMIKKNICNQTVANLFIKAFNENRAHAIRCVSSIQAKCKLPKRELQMMGLLECTEEVHGFVTCHFAVDPFVEPELSDNDDVERVNQAIALQFARYTYERSDRQLVVELRSAGRSRLFRDPVIHSKWQGQCFGMTDRGQVGIDAVIGSTKADEFHAGRNSSRDICSNTSEATWFCDGYLCTNTFTPQNQTANDSKPCFCDSCNVMEAETTKTVRCIVALPDGSECGIVTKFSEWYYRSQCQHPPQLCAHHRGTNRTNASQSWRLSKTIPFGVQNEQRFHEVAEILSKPSRALRIDIQPSFHDCKLKIESIVQRYKPLNKTEISKGDFQGWKCIIAEFATVEIASAVKVCLEGKGLGKIRVHYHTTSSDCSSSGVSSSDVDLPQTQDTGRNEPLISRPVQKSVQTALLPRRPQVSEPSVDSQQLIQPIATLQTAPVAQPQEEPSSEQPPSTPTATMNIVELVDLFYHQWFTQCIEYAHTGLITGLLTQWTVAKQLAQETDAVRKQRISPPCGGGTNNTGQVPSEQSPSASATLQDDNDGSVDSAESATDTDPDPGTAEVVVDTMSDNRSQSSEEANSSFRTKRCLYFNRRKGCRNGASCPYSHDKCGQRVPHVPEASSTSANNGTKFKSFSSSVDVSKDDVEVVYHKMSKLMPDSHNLVAWARVGAKQIMMDHVMRLYPGKFQKEMVGHNLKFRHL